MKEALKEEIGVWKENLKAVIYLFVLDISGTIARAVKVGIVDTWVISGILVLYLVLIGYYVCWKKLKSLINQLREFEE